jgi:hypothetical protein
MPEVYLHVTSFPANMPTFPIKFVRCDALAGKSSRPMLCGKSPVEARFLALWVQLYPFARVDLLAVTFTVSHCHNSHNSHNSAHCFGCLAVRLQCRRNHALSTTATTQ